MAKYKQVMQVSLCGNIKRDAFDAVTVNGGDVMEIVGKHLREEGIERGKIRITVLEEMPEEAKANETV
ncbi:hypothetical protein [Hominenteromicrobium sp.]|uniref:hypothetical protein n=1 Tax=Hominenteromicrobium sp. TaxID=3073581 RepID=UPI003A90F624